MLHLPGYWPSYNIPFHADIYNLSGYSVMWKRYGEDFSYDLCPRAKILRRDQAKVHDLSSLKHLMRYNSRSIVGLRPLLFSDCKQRDYNHIYSFCSDYRREPYSKGHPCKTICCRNDLRLRRPHPGGCYDTKVRGHQFTSTKLRFILWSCTVLFTVYCVLIQFKISEHLEKTALVHLISHLTTLFSCLRDVHYMKLYLGKD